MNRAAQVYKNSVFLTVQPLVMNLISLFVVGYMARVLGHEDYGRFIFAFSFVALFSPLGSMGLRGVTIRDMAENKEGAPIYVGNIVVFRFFLALLAIGIMGIVLELMNYSVQTKLVCYVAGIAFFMENLSHSYKDGLQAFEKMEFVALSQFLAGLVLTAATIILLLLGLGVVEISLTYALGSLVGLWSALRFFRRFSPLKLGMDLSFWKNSLKSGAPFLASGLLLMGILKMDVVLLSQFSGEVAVGIYGAAAILFYRLGLISDSVATALFPATAATFKTSRAEAHHLFQDVFSLLLFIALPMAAGLSLTASQIIHLIYGSQYDSSVMILKIIAWAIPPFFLATLCNYCLGAIHLQAKSVKATLITALVGLLANVLLIRSFGGLGAALGVIFIHFLYLSTVTFMVYRYFGPPLRNGFLFKTAISTLGMGLLVYSLRGLNILILVPAAAAFYFAFTLLFKLVSIREFVSTVYGFVKQPS